MQRGSARANNRGEREHARMAVSKACLLVDGRKSTIGMKGRNDDQDWKNLSCDGRDVRTRRAMGRGGGERKRLRKRRREQAGKSTLGEARYSQPSTPERAM
jgi:hypothetical protein